MYKTVLKTFTNYIYRHKLYISQGDICKYTSTKLMFYTKILSAKLLLLICSDIQVDVKFSFKIVVNIILK